MKTYNFDDFTLDNDNETIIQDMQVWVSLFNPLVSDIFRDIALEEVNTFIANNKEITFDKSDTFVGILEAYMTKNIGVGKKYNILIFISNEEEGYKKDCLINIPLLPTKSYFADFKHLIMMELEHLIFG